MTIDATRSQAPLLRGGLRHRVRDMIQLTSVDFGWDVWNYVEFLAAHHIPLVSTASLHLWQDGDAILTRGPAAAGCSGDPPV